MQQRQEGPAIEDLDLTAAATICEKIETLERLLAGRLKAIGTVTSEGVSYRCEIIKTLKYYSIYVTKQADNPTTTLGDRTEFNKIITLSGTNQTEERRDGTLFNKVSYRFDILARSDGMSPAGTVTGISNISKQGHVPSPDELLKTFVPTETE